MEALLKKYLTPEFKAELKTALVAFVITSFLFGSAIVALALALLADQSGEHGTAQVFYILTLVLSFAGGLYAVPRLAKRIRLNFLRFRISYSATPETAFFLVIWIVVGLAALNTGNNLLYLIFAILLAVIITSGIISEIGLRELDVGLRFPDHIYAKQEVNLDLAITNHKRVFPSFSLSVGAELAGHAQGSTFGEKMREVFLGITPDGELSRLAHFVVVPRRQKLRQTVPFTFRKRGRYTIAGFSISTKFPFGFIQKTRHIGAQGEVVVYPELESRAALSDGANALNGTIENLLKGNGADLYAIRHYQSGDNLRHIDWKATAKAQRTMVREFTRDDERRVTMYFDPRLAAEPTEAELEAFERGVRRAASVAARLIETNVEVRLIVPGQDTGFGNSQTHLHDILRILALVVPEYDSTTADSAGRVEEFQRRLSASAGSGILFTAATGSDERLSRFRRNGIVVPFSSIVSADVRKFAGTGNI